MIPKPKALEDRPEFGNKKQIDAMHAYVKVRGAENMAKLKTNNTQATFFLDGRSVFEALFPSAKTAEDMAIKIYELNDKKWTFDKVKYRTRKRSAFKCQQT